MFKIVFFVPESHKETVKMAEFEAGAGKIGDYDQCAWEVAGTGQFRPLQGATPYIGDVGKTGTVAEYRVELVCDDQCVVDAITALKQAHPYEEPAFDVWKLHDINV